MRMFGAIGVAFAALAVAQVQGPPENQEPAIAEGQVVSIATGQPIPHATITLRPLSVSSNPENASGGYAMDSDDAGTFHFEKLAPGKYDLLAKKVGFLNTNYGARRANGPGIPIVLDAGKTSTKLEIKMYPEATISGVTIDDRGEPLVARVNLLRRAWIQGRPNLMPAGGVSSDSHGRFLISGIAPGRYLLRAEIQNFNSGRALVQVDRQGNVVNAHLVTTYLGDTTDDHEATLISVQPGQEVSGATIRFVREPTFHIKGRIISVPPNESPQAYMPILSVKDSWTYTAGATRPNKDGSFEIDNVQPGSYTVNLTHGGMGFSASVPVQVSNGNVDNLEVSIPPPMELHGRVYIDNQNEADLSGSQISLQTAEIMFGAQATSAKDGTFVLRNVVPGHYRVNVYAPGQSSYVKTIQFGGRESVENSIDVAEGTGGTLEIQLGGNPAQVEGVVTKPDDTGLTTLPVAAINVVAIPQKWTGDFFGGLKRGSTDAQGHFTLKGLEPGKYKIFAAENIDTNQWSDPEHLLLARLMLGRWPNLASAWLPRSTPSPQLWR
jgi:protocatechuate 3,4-dioxygenase beta subunit